MTIQERLKRPGCLKSQSEVQEGIKEHLHSVINRHQECPFSDIQIALYLIIVLHFLLAVCIKILSSPRLELVSRIEVDFNILKNIYLKV